MLVELVRWWWSSCDSSEARAMAVEIVEQLRSRRCSSHVNVSVIIVEPCGISTGHGRKVVR
jgi:hypothetical protein